MANVVIVTGGRDWKSWFRVFRALDGVGAQLVVQGGCPTGTDLFARQWAHQAKVECITFEADWLKLGKSAGPKRNAMMLEAYPSAIVLGFPTGGPGTRDCLKRAEKLGMHVIVHQPAVMAD